MSSSMEVHAEAVLNHATRLEHVKDLVKGRADVEIDCGVMEVGGVQLNWMMKEARKAGVEHFILRNVCGQNLIGTGISGPARISVYGIMGNHSGAFVDNLVINTYPTALSNGVWCPGDAQVAIGTSANPRELNIAGSVDDLFASYAPSGIFRVAGQGGNRSGLRAGAGIPAVWREIDYSSYAGMSNDEVCETLLARYQKRRADIQLMGWESFIDGFKKEAERRTPPVIVFGRRVKDYFMEYAQGTIGIVLNLYGMKSPTGYFLCSGMTAGMAFIRGEVDDNQLGVHVQKGTLEDSDRDLLLREMKGFYDCFKGSLDSDRYQENLADAMELADRDPEEYTGGFVKIEPK